VERQEEVTNLWRKPIRRLTCPPGSTLNPFLDKPDAKSKGLYAGLILEGSAVDVRESLNEAYYGKAVTPVQIIVERKASRKGSTGLCEELKKADK